MIRVKFGYDDWIFFKSVLSVLRVWRVYGMKYIFY